MLSAFERAIAQNKIRTSHNKQNRTRKQQEKGENIDTSAEGESRWRWINEGCR